MYPFACNNCQGVQAGLDPMPNPSSSLQYCQYCRTGRVEVCYGDINRIKVQCSDTLCFGGKPNVIALYDITKLRSVSQCPYCKACFTVPVVPEASFPLKPMPVVSMWGYNAQCAYAMFNSLVPKPLYDVSFSIDPGMVVQSPDKTECFGMFSTTAAQRQIIMAPRPRVHELGSNPEDHGDTMTLRHGTFVIVALKHEPGMVCTYMKL